MFQIAPLKCSSCNAEIVELLVTGANNVIVFGLRRWFGVYRQAFSQHGLFRAKLNPSPVNVNKPAA
jgi:hypothetical protein